MALIDTIIRNMSSYDWPSEYWRQTNIHIPELQQSTEVIQNNGLSVLEHTMDVMDLLPIKNSITILAALFHDLGKVVVDYNGPSRFAGHEVESALIAENSLRSWNANKKLTDCVVRLVVMHMYDMSPPFSDKSILKFVSKVRADNIDNWFSLRMADSRSYSKYHEYYSGYILPFRNKVDSFLANNTHTEKIDFECSNGSGCIQIEGGDR